MHPTPWKVAYSPMCPEWDQKSGPMVVDASGDLVCAMPQNVGHPGQYDPLADATANQIVGAVNKEDAGAARWTKSRPTETGYYWFYGTVKTGKRANETRLMIVDVTVTHYGGTPCKYFVANGAFWREDEFDGVWQRIPNPELPS